MIVAAVAVLALAAASMALFDFAGTRAAAPASITAPPGTFRPTAAQLADLKIEPVRLVSFRSERYAEGNIAIDDDLTTPVFSPYSGRVERLVAQLGDHVARGAPLFAVEATEFVQAAERSDRRRCRLQHRRARSWRRRRPTKSARTSSIWRKAAR